MLSYQHGYHAGNASDVLKHFCLFSILRSLLRKDTPFHIFDGNAGAGVYDLSSVASRKTGEATDGIEKVLRAIECNAEEVPDTVKEWHTHLARMSKKLPRGKAYPGSPAWTQSLMRDEDRATLFELHPREVEKLKEWRGKDRRFQIHKQDSYQHLPNYLPPKERRGLILIDPSYERLEEYELVPALLKACLKKFSSGIYLVWYPVVARGRSELLLKAIEEMKVPNTVHLRLNLRKESDTIGMNSTGIVILGSPPRLTGRFEEALLWFSRVLGR